MSPNINKIIESVNCQFGAPMGRTSKIVSLDKLYLQKLNWIDADYDCGGAYWGNSGDFIWVAFNDETRIYQRAFTREQAKYRITEQFPDCKFLRA